MSAEQVSMLAPPGASSRDLARRLGVAGFWGWWAGELAALLPAPLRAGWQRRHTRPAIAFDSGHATLWRPASREGRLAMLPEGDVAVDADGHGGTGARAAVAALARAAGEGLPLRVTLCLPARAVLRKTIVLPAAVEENLRQVIGYDLDRHTPFKAEELYFDAAVSTRDAVRETVRVELAAARRSIVDGLIREVEGWGAVVTAVSAEPPNAPSHLRLDLLPPDRETAAPAWRRWQVWLPATVLALLVLAATLLPLWQKRENAIALRIEADAAREHAAVSETLRAELDRQVGDYNYALERKFAFPSTVQILDDVTRILPDDTWLTQFELRTTRGKEISRELGLRGESANAGRLVSMLEESKLFTQAAPRSPTTKIQPGPGEIFDVGAQLKPLPPPGTPPVVVAAGAPAPAAAAPGAAHAAAPASAARPPPPAPAAAAAPGAATAPASAAAPGAVTGPASAAPPPPAASVSSRPPAASASSATAASTTTGPAPAVAPAASTAAAPAPGTTAPPAPAVAATPAVPGNAGAAPVARANPGSQQKGRT